MTLDDNEARARVTEPLASVQATVVANINKAPFVLLNIPLRLVQSQTCLVKLARQWVNERNSPQRPTGSIGFVDLERTERTACRPIASHLLWLATDGTVAVPTPFEAALQRSRRIESMNENQLIDKLSTTTQTSRSLASPFGRLKKTKPTWSLSHCPLVIEKRITGAK